MFTSKPQKELIILVIIIVRSTIMFTSKPQKESIILVIIIAIPNYAAPS